MALQGLYNFLQSQRDRGTLHNLVRDNGTISCVFLCCDLPYQYLDEYFKKLGSDYFRPIINKVCNTFSIFANNADLIPRTSSISICISMTLSGKSLISVDDAFLMLYGIKRKDIGVLNSGRKAGFSNLDFPRLNLQPQTILLDLRSKHDFNALHLPGAINHPLQSLKEKFPSPFDNAKVLEEQWIELEAMFGSLGSNPPSTIVAGPNDDVAIICPYGDTSRVASSVLRAKNVKADSVKGGMDAVTTDFHE